MTYRILLVVGLFLPVLLGGCSSNSETTTTEEVKPSKVQQVNLEDWASEVMVDTTLGITCFKKIPLIDSDSGYFDCIPTVSVERKVTDELVSLFNWSDEVLLDDKHGVLCFKNRNWTRGYFACVPQDKVKPEGLAELRGMLEKPLAEEPPPVSDVE